MTSLEGDCGVDTRFVRRLLRRQLRLVLAGAGVIGLFTLIVGLLRPPTYQASTTLLVNQGRGIAAPDYESVLMSQQLTRTYAELLKKRPLYEMVITSLQLEITPDRLMRNVRVSTIRDTQLIVVTVYDRSPQRAADIANELVRVLREQDRQMLSGTYGGDIRGLNVVEPAQLDPVPASPKIVRDTLLTLILGFLGMTGVALVREYTDTTIKDGGEAEQATGALALGVIGRSLDSAARFEVIDQASDPSREAYRILAVRLRGALSDHSARSLMVASAEPLTDVLAVAVHLAIIYAQLGQRIVLVDGDLRRPTLHSWFNLKGDVGLRDMLECTHDVPVYRYLIPTPVANLFLLPGGAPVPNPLSLFDLSRLRRCLQDVYQHANLVIVAAPAVLRAAESLLLAQAVDAALLVVRAETTHSAAAALARSVLDQASVRVSGLVLTGVPDDDVAVFAYGAHPSSMAQQAAGMHLLSSLSFNDAQRPHPASTPPVSALPSHSTDR